jgi:NitT/TauT family transport system substrate-binding protein
MNTNRSKLILRLAIIVIGFPLVFAGACNTTPTKKPFRVAFNTWVGYSPLLLAKEKGFLNEEGIDAEISFLEGVGEKNSALIRGDVDAVGHTADAAVVSAASGVDGQIILHWNRASRDTFSS